MAEEGKEVLPFRSRADFDDTYPFRGEFAHIQVNHEDLRRDVVAEAIKQGVPEQIAGAFARNINFDIEPVADYMSKILSPLDKVRFKIGTSLGITRNTMGAVDTRSKDQPRCFLDVPVMVKFCDDNGNIPFIKIPKSAPLEAYQLALKMLLNSIWDHERQHLIQVMDPQRKENMNKQISRNNFKTTIYTGVSLTFAAGSIAVNLLTAYSRENALFSLMLIGLSGITMTAGRFDRDRSYRHSDHEREAYRTMKYDDKLPSPFQVSFEK